MPVAQPEVVLGRAATRPVPGAVAAGPGAGVGRGASRGRQERENIIFTRPSKDFDKKGGWMLLISNDVIKELCLKECMAQMASNLC